MTFTEEPAGRETLSAISHDRRPFFAPPNIGRERATTKHYGDRISNAPGAVSPKVARALARTPEVTVQYSPAGRETYAAIRKAENEEPPEIEISGETEASEPLVSSLEIEQVHAFVIQGTVRQLRTEAAQRELIETRLVACMHGLGMEDVSRVEVRTGPEPGTVLFHVWTRVP